MGNPRTTALISAGGIVLIGANMLFNSQGVSPLLGTLQWVLLIAGVIGLAASLLRLGRK